MNKILLIVPVMVMLSGCCIINSGNNVRFVTDNHAKEGIIKDSVSKVRDLQGDIISEDKIMKDKVSGDKTDDKFF